MWSTITSTFIDGHHFAETLTSSSDCQSVMKEMSLKPFLTIAMAQIPLAAMMDSKEKNSFMYRNTNPVLPSG